MRWIALLLGLLSAQAFAQEASETRELIGQLGGRAALLNLYATAQPDGSARVTGDYLVLPTLQQRFLEGERSKQLGVTFLKEGDDADPLRPAGDGDAAGHLVGRRLQGRALRARAGRSASASSSAKRFPSMDGYSAQRALRGVRGTLRLDARLAVENGKLKSLDWRSKVSPGRASLHGRAGSSSARTTAACASPPGRCSVTLRDLGDYVRVTAEDCAAMCGSQGYLEPVLVDRRGNCQLLRPRTR